MARGFRLRDFALINFEGVSELSARGESTASLGQHL
jgi:hypothetical protein